MDRIRSPGIGGRQAFFSKKVDFFRLLHLFYAIFASCGKPIEHFFVHPKHVVGALKATVVALLRFDDTLSNLHENLGIDQCQHHILFR